MPYIIIAIIVLILARKLLGGIFGAIISLFKHVLFNPRVNSILTLVLVLCFLVAKSSSIDEKYMPLLKVLWVICAIDCVRDIIVADSYYGFDPIYGIDRFYALKSITGIFTLELTRVIFLLILGPVCSRSEKNRIKERINGGFPIPEQVSGNIKAGDYYYRKWLKRFERQELIVSNRETVNREREDRKQRLARLYPQKLILKVAEATSNDEEVVNTRRKRSVAEGKISRMVNCYAYLGADAFHAFAGAITTAMQGRGYCSADTIVLFDDLKSLNLTFPLVGKNFEWSEYFVIQALQPLVDEGVFEDSCFDDKDPTNTHAYHYTKSSASMKSTNGNKDPRFYDPDLCD